MKSIRELHTKANNILQQAFKDVGFKIVNISVTCLMNNNSDELYFGINYFVQTPEGKNVHSSGNDKSVEGVLQKLILNTDYDIAEYKNDLAFAQIKTTDLKIE